MSAALPWPRRATNMLILLAAFCFFLLAGSLYPWTFAAGPPLDHAIRRLLTGWDNSVQNTGLRDIVVNLVIYIPIGFTGFLWSGWRHRLTRIGVPLVIGTLISFTVEILQNYVPSRMPGLTDVACNSVSTALGVMLAAIFQRIIEAHHGQRSHRHVFQFSSAILLLSLWIAGLGWPDRIFGMSVVPRVRILLHPGAWSPPDSLNGAMPWMLAGCLLTVILDGNYPRWWLWALLPLIFGLMLASPGHIFTWSYVGGAVAAVALHSLLPQDRRGTSVALAWLWLVWLVVEGLRPFHFSTHAQPFGWVPFKEMLGIAWMPSIGVLLRKTWAYGAAFWLLSRTRHRRLSAFLLTAVTVTSIEAAQRWIPGRTPGITDLVIAALAASLFWLVDRRFAPLAAPATLDQPGSLS